MRTRKKQPQTLATRLAPLPLAISLAAGGLLAAMASPQALAQCDYSLATLTCKNTSEISGYDATASGSMTVNVQLDAIVRPSAAFNRNSLMSISAPEVTFNNWGKVYTGFIAGQQQVTGIQIASTAGGEVRITNYPHAEISGLRSMASALSLQGNALLVENASGGTTVLDNQGLITSSVRLVAGDATTLGSVIALRGGARNVVRNASSGEIRGRVALQASAEGNAFYNAGKLVGSVHLGAGGAANAFYAITNSTIGSDNQSAPAQAGPAGSGLDYAALGYVDGGSANNGNTLYLRNNISGPGQGSAGVGILDASRYLNFSRLVVDSGSWTLSGHLFDASSLAPSVQLNAGQLTISDSDVFGNASLVGNGGTLRGAATDLANAIELVDGTFLRIGGLGLSGVISGGGGLIVDGSVTLAGANTFSGGVQLHGGDLSVDSDAALGSGVLSVIGSGTLSGGPVSVHTLDNAVSLAGDLTLGGGLVLSGPISGSGDLVKNGSADLTLNGGNTFSGNTVLNAGRLLLGNATALGSGQLIAAAGSGLEANTVLTVANGVTVNGPLYVGGSVDFGLSGVIDGSGGLVKYGSASLSLLGANTYQGGTVLTAGTLNIGHGQALGSGGLTVAGMASLTSNGTQRLANAVRLDAELNLSGNANLILDGVIDGSGALRKSGAGSVTLNGANTYSGGTILQRGTLVLGSASALGSGRLQAGAGSVLDSNKALAIGNAISLAGELNIFGSHDLTLAGDIDGAGGLSKSGGTRLVLAGDNSYLGDTRLRDGSLVLASASALGQSVLHASGAASLEAASALAIGNLIKLYGNLTIAGAADLTLNGSVGGNGRLSKTGQATLTLNAANSYSGGTTLAGGRLVLGNGLALGSGTLSVTGPATLDNQGAIHLGNAIELIDALSIGGSADLTLGGTISGGGRLIKNGAGTLILNGVNSYSGGTWLNAGSLRLGNARALGLGALNVTGAASLDNGTALSLDNAISLGADLTLAGHADLILDGDIDGGAALIKSGSGRLTLNGENHHAGGTVLRGGTLVLGSATALGSGALSVTGAAGLESATDLALGNAIVLDAELAVDGSHALTLGGVISGSGGLAKHGSGELTLSGANAFSGAVNVLAGSLRTVGAGSLGQASSVTVGAAGRLDLGASAAIGSLAGSGAVRLGDGTWLSVGRGDRDGLFSGVLSGDGGLIKVGGGRLQLAGQNTYGGATEVNGGVLDISGALAGGQVRVNDGGSLTGSGSIAGQVYVANGGHLALASGANLSLGSLLLSETASLDVGLASPASGGSPLLTVAGDLTLAGTLNVSDIGGLGAGIYRLIDYGGTLSDNGLVIGSLAGALQPGDLQLQTAIGSQVNLLVGGANGNVLFWDGGNSASDGVIHGGSGNWSDQGGNWTDVDGQGNRDWNGTFAVFQGSAGDVTVTGSQAITGLQFVVDGYRLDGPGELQLVGGGATGTVLRVDPNVTATLTLGLSGSGLLNKVDSGTLVLDGASSYSGGTLLSGGGLVLGNDAALGSGLLSAAHGTTLDSNRSVTLGNQIALRGNLNLAGSHALSLTGAIGGLGSLVKHGSGRLTLSGANTYAGGTWVHAGELWLDHDQALGGGALHVVGSHVILGSDSARSLANAFDLGASLNLDGAGDLTLHGVLSGTGGLLKEGSGKLTLNGLNTYAGGTVLGAGSLTLGNAGALGSGALTVGGAASLDNSVAMAIGNRLALDASLTLPGSADLTLNGVLSGTGALHKTGSGTLVLNNHNTYQGGTTLAAGTLVLGNDGALGSGRLHAAAGSRLDSNRAVSLGNQIDLLGLLTILGSNDLTLGGVIDGSGGLVKDGVGTLTLSGTNSHTGDTWLNAGRLVLGSDTALGLGALHASGGTLLDSVGGANRVVANAIHLAGELGLGSGLTLNGVLDGAGGLLVHGDLTLNGVNTYQGGTWLNGGSLRLGNSSAIGSGALNVGGASTLAGTFNLGNAINLGALLTLDGSNDITLDGNVAGTGALLKSGMGTLTLNGSSSYSGGTTLADGTLLVGSDSALGNGALNVTGAGTFLDAANNSGIAIANAIALGANTLTFSGGNQLAVNGNITGTGGLLKSGLAELTLGGNNTFSGGVRLNAGTLVLASATGLGSGALTAAGGIFNNTVAASLNNAVHLLGSLTLNGAQSLALNGVIDGTGNLAKTGTGNLLLTGNNTYTGNTFLLGGTTTVGSNTAFGTGNITISVAGLDSSTAVTLANNFSVLGNLIIGGTSDLTLNGALSGAGGRLTKNGAGILTLNGSNSFAAGVQLNAGTLAVGQNDSLGSGNLIVGGNVSLVSGSNNLTLGNAIVLNGNLGIDGANALGLSGTLSGGGQLLKSGSGNLTLSGNNSTWGGGVVLSGGTLSISGNNALGSGALVANGNATLDSSAVILANAIVVNGTLTLNTSTSLLYTGQLSGSGNLIKTGADGLVLQGNNSFNGTWDILDGVVTTVGGSALGAPGLVRLGSGALLNLNGSVSFGGLAGSGTIHISQGNTLAVGGDADSVFAGVLTGSGQLDKVGSGVLELSGTSMLGSPGMVSSGTLKVSGLLGGGLTVGSGATLTGGGTLGGQVQVAAGGHLAGSSGQTLTFGSLIVASNANIDVALGSPGSGSQPLFSVNSDLTLGGTLNVSDAGGFGNGVYRLFDYGGSLINNGLAIGSLPGMLSSADVQLQTVVAHQVNLVVNAPNLIMQFWDGGNTTSNGLIEGGSGVWDSTTSNWADYDGFSNLDWQGQFAVFQAATGTVIVDGQQNVNGMQFMTDGYQLVAGTNGSLNISNRNGTYFAVRVDNGVTATLDLPLEGTGTLTKLDVGTLVLNGANTYSGGTALNGGTLVLGNDSALGSGDLTTAAGTTLDSNQALTVGNNVAVTGALNLAGSNDLTLNGVVSGSGSLVKNGNGSLTLGGANTFSGPLLLNAGSLVLASNGALGRGTLNAANGTRLDSSTALSLGNAINLAGNLMLSGSHDLTLDGVINGSGSLLKTGNASLTLNGANGFGGGVNLQAGTLKLGHAAALGSGTLTVGGLSSLDSTGALALANRMQLLSTLTLAGSHDLTLNGTISGSGRLVKDGSGRLALHGVNDFTGGLELAGGQLWLGNASALGSGTLNATGSVQLDVGQAMSLANNVTVGGALSLGGSHDLTLAGTLSGSGTLNKQGAATLTLAGNNSFTGTLNILSGTLATRHGGALGSPAQVNLGHAATLELGGDASLGVLNGSGSVRVLEGGTLALGGGLFSGTLSGGGGLDKVGSGNLTLSGANQLSGATTVSAGSLTIAGSLASASVTVQSGASLGGGGELSGSLIVADGGSLNLRSGDTLKVGSLQLDGQSILDASLGAALAGQPGLISVAGDLTLDGRLNVTDVGGFGAGVYRLIDYSGNLTDNGLVIGSLPGSVNASDVELQTAIGNQVNLVVGGASNVLFWNGAQTSGNGTVAGGSGTWEAGGSNWTGTDASQSKAWNGTFAVFQGNAGTVTVNGSQAITGMQFASDGYTINGGSGGELLTSGTTNIRVDSGHTATLGVAINGSGTLTKLDNGTLVLNGANHYSGGTVLSGGTLVVGNDAALGSGSLNTASGTTLDSNRAVTLANELTLGGALTIGGSHALTLDGALGGSGGLVKDGNADLTLNGVNTFSGGVTLNAGSLTLGNAAALGSGTLTVGGDARLARHGDLQLNNDIDLAAQLTLVGDHDLDLSGGISGGGGLVKEGLGTLLLSGNNSYTGGTIINAGSLSGDTGSLQGTIVNNATLVFEQAAAGSYAGSLSGAGMLVKNGSGQLLLSGHNTFTGSTYVNAGSLMVNGSLASAQVQVASGASLGGSGTYSGSVHIADGARLIAGSATAPLTVGNLELSSGSLLEFALGNPDVPISIVHVNGNLVLDGTLDIADAGGFGSGVYQLFTYGGSLVDNGLDFGILPSGVDLTQLELQTSIGHQVNLVVGSGVQFWNGTQLTADGNIVGGDGVWGAATNWSNSDGSVARDWGGQFAVFSGQGGTVSLDGVQSFDGLQFLSDGYRIVGDASNHLEALNAADGSLAALRVANGISATIEAPLSGSGGIEKLDTGTLVLSGANDYSGGTIVSAGLLAGNTVSLQGAIVNNANLLFQQDSYGTFNGTLSGTGTTYKSGTGTLLLTGAHGFSGTFNVEQGVLQVGTSPATSLAADVVVAQGAGLTGGGSVASLTNHGEVAPGTDGNLSVDGNFVNASDGTLSIALTPLPTSHLVVGGSATLAGTLNVFAIAPYSGDITYTLLSAAGGISGTFDQDNVGGLGNGGLAFIDTVLNYGANDLTLSVSRNGHAFADLGETRNQRRTAAALEATGPASLQAEILTLDRAGAVAAFDSLSGEIHASTAGVLLEDSRHLRNSLTERMRQGGCDNDPRNLLAPSGNQQQSSAGCQGQGVGWISALGAWADHDGSHGTDSAERELSGFLLGYDNALNEQWRAGIAAGYSHTSLNTRRHGDASVDSYHLASYLDYRQDAFSARLGAGYSWHDIDTKRQVTAGSYNERHKASYQAGTAQAFAEVAYAIDAGGLALEPFAGIAHARYDSDKGREKGGAARLAASSKQDATFTTVGLRAGKQVTLDNGSTLTPRVSLGWRHALGDTRAETDLRFIDGGATFTNQGVALARNAAVLEAGVELSVGAHGKLGLGYNGQLSSDSRDHAMSISFSLGF